MSDPDVTAYVTKLLCSHGGCLERSRLAKVMDRSEPEIQQILSEESERFPQSGRLILAQSPLRVCYDYLHASYGCPEGAQCPKLHICGYYLKGRCFTNRRIPCVLCHDLQSDHNRTVLKDNDLHGLNKNEIKILLCQNDSSMLPMDCAKYMKDDCDKEEDCQRLHLCRRFARGDCNNRNCARSHNMLDSRVLRCCDWMSETSIRNFQTLCDLKHNERHGIQQNKGGRGASETREGGRGRSQGRSGEGSRERQRDESRSESRERHRGKSRDKIRERRNGSRGRHRGKSRSESRERYRGKSRSESRERYRGKSRSKSRGRYRGKSRSESRERYRGKSRSKSRERYRRKSRSESRERYRGKSRERYRGKSRSKSRGRYRGKSRSESRERYRGKNRSKSRGKHRGKCRDGSRGIHRGTGRDDSLDMLKGCKCRQRSCSSGASSTCSRSSGNDDDDDSDVPRRRATAARKSLEKMNLPGKRPKPIGASKTFLKDELCIGSENFIEKQSIAQPKTGGNNLRLSPGKNTSPNIQPSVLPTQDLPAKELARVKPILKVDTARKGLPEMPNGSKEVIEPSIAQPKPKGDTLGSSPGKKSSQNVQPSVFPTQGLTAKELARVKPILKADTARKDSSEMPNGPKEVIEETLSNAQPKPKGDKMGSSPGKNSSPKVQPPAIPTQDLLAKELARVKPNQNVDTARKDLTEMYIRPKEVIEEPSTAQPKPKGDKMGSSPGKNSSPNVQPPGIPTQDLLAKELARVKPNQNVDTARKDLTEMCIRPKEVIEPSTTQPKPKGDKLGSSPGKNSSPKVQPSGIPTQDLLPLFNLAKALARSKCILEEPLSNVRPRPGGYHLGLSPGKTGSSNIQPSLFPGQDLPFKKIASVKPTQKPDTAGRGLPQMSGNGPHPTAPQPPPAKDLHYVTAQTSVPEVTPTLCLSHIWRRCKLGGKCPSMHYCLPYRWQELHATTWRDLPDMEGIEKAYSDPNNDSYKSINFQTMRSGPKRLRRLCTPSSVTPTPESALPTEWIWYWKDASGRWIQYGQENTKEMGPKMSSDHKILYLNNPSDTIAFHAGTPGLSTPDEIRQWMAHFLVGRELRRRPKFLGSEDVKALKGSTKPAAQSPAAPPESANYPKSWNTEAMQEEGYRKFPVDESSGEFSDITSVFHQTMSGHKVKRLWRVQNPSLWQVYERQKDQMKKRNADVGVREFRLFHGTDGKNTKLICTENFNWSLCGSNGTVYGQGCYFAKFARYSHHYSPPDSSGTRTMMVARVLVGDSIKGHTQMKCPPEKPDGCQRYDSCVDDVFSPSIYVLYAKSQIYPEYILEYGEEDACTIC